jgi:hypothetical protein
MIVSLHPASFRRGASRSSRVLEAGCDGRSGATDERACCGRQKRVVLIPRRWDQVCRCSANDGGYQARTPGRARHKPVNHRAGNAGVAPVHLWSYPCAFYCTGPTGAIGTRHSLRPPIFRRGNIMHHSGISCRENANARCQLVNLRFRHSGPIASRCPGMTTILAARHPAYITKCLRLKPTSQSSAPAPPA